MSSKRSSSYRTSNVRSKRSLPKMEQTVDDQLVSVNVSLRAAYEPIVQLPASIKLLQEEGRGEDVPKIGALCRSIASDIKIFTEERDKISSEWQETRKNRPTDNSGMAEYNMKITTTGLDYINLNQRIAETVLKSKQDFEEILEGRAPSAPSTPPQESHA